MVALGAIITEVIVGDLKDVLSSAIHVFALPTLAQTNLAVPTTTILPVELHLPPALAAAKA